MQKPRGGGEERMPWEPATGVSSLVPDEGSVIRVWSQQTQLPPGEGGISPDPEELKLAAVERDGTFILETLLSLRSDGRIFLVC